MREKLKRLALPIAAAILALLCLSCLLVYSHLANMLDSQHQAERWQGEGETAVFRKSLGEEDNSGDYTMYSEKKEVAVGNLTVTLKGDDGAYPLAVWSDDGYACSLRVTCAMTVEEWTSVLAAC